MYNRKENIMNPKLVDENLDYMFEAIMKLETVEESYNFFEDLCTIQELKSISQRLHVARLLNKKIVYNKIVDITGASTATISRVNRALNYGNDGYIMIFDRMGETRG